MSILAIGTVAFDDIETPFGKSDKILGGSASYIGVSAAAFTASVNIVAVIGDDMPQQEIDMMKSKGVDTEGLQVKQGEKSFFWAGRYHNDMNSRDTLITELNVLANFDPIIPDNYQDCRYLLLGNLAPTTQKAVIERLKKRPELIVMDTMNFWMDNAWDELLEVMQMVDVISINDEEARQLSKEYSLVKAARKIMTMGPKTVIIKKGEHGALLFQENRMFYAPALPLESVFDPTGAGDTFVGGFIGYLAKNDDTSFAAMKRGILYGSAVASFCVEAFGLKRLETLTINEIEARYEEFIRLVSVEEIYAG